MAREHIRGKLFTLEISEDFDPGISAGTWKTLGCSQNDTFTGTNETENVTCKDSDGFSAPSPTTQSAEVSNETYHIIDDDVNSLDTEDIETLFKNQTLFYWRQRWSDGADTPVLTDIRWGKGFISSFENTGEVEGVASVSITIPCQSYELGTIPTP